MSRIPENRGVPLVSVVIGVLHSTECSRAVSPSDCQICIFAPLSTSSPPSACAILVAGIVTHDLNAPTFEIDILAHMREGGQDSLAFLDLTEVARRILDGVRHVVQTGGHSPRSRA